MKKLMLLAAAGAGYVLGAKAGRERYDQIAGAARKVTQDPRVRSTTQHAADTVRQQAPVVAENVKDKVGGAASAATAKVRGHDDEAAATPANGTVPQG